MQDSENKIKAQLLGEGLPKEALLELIQTEEGHLELRDAQNKEEPLVCIQFSDAVNKMLEGDVQVIGQHMIQAAIQFVMHKQMINWHANVYDEEPQYYS